MVKCSSDGRTTKFQKGSAGQILRKTEVVDSDICYLIQLLCLANILEWFYKTGIIIQKKLLRHL